MPWNKKKKNITDVHLETKQ